MDLNTELQSYSVITAEMVCAHLGLPSPKQDMRQVFSDPNSNYAILCQLPFMHIYNNLIVDQIVAYKEYIQKKLCDYFIDNNPSEEELELAEGEQTISERIEYLKSLFIQRKQDLDELLEAVSKNIDASQKLLCGFVKKELKGNVSELEIPKNILESIDYYYHGEYGAMYLRTQLVQERDDWKEFAISVTETLAELGYRTDELADAQNTSALKFNTDLGRN